MSFNDRLNHVLNETIQLGPLAGLPWVTRGPEADDDNQLVAYRLFYEGRIAQYVWIVNYKDYAIATITRKDSKWVHDNWDFSISNHEYQKVITPENRGVFIDLLKQLINKIRQAIKTRRADVVTIPVGDAQPTIKPTDQEDPAIAALPTLQDRIKARIAARQHAG